MMENACRHSAVRYCPHGLLIAPCWFPAWLFFHRFQFWLLLRGLRLLVHHVQDVVANLLDGIRVLVQELLKPLAPVDLMLVAGA